MSNRFGKSRLGGESKHTYLGLKDGENVFRILPAMGDLAEDGRWSMYYAVHYGYKNSKDKGRPFQSPLVKNNKTKMIEVPDAALDRINNLTAQLEKAKAEGNTDLAQKLDKLVGRGPNSKAQFNLDKKHYMNALDLQGNIVVLKLSHTAKLALDTEIKKQRAAGVDPLSDSDGRYLSFFRSGKSRDTQVQVTVYKKEIEVAGVGKVQKDVSHSIDDTLADRLVKFKDGKYVYGEAVNLAKLYPKPTAEQVARIVKEGKTAVDEIIDGAGASDSSGGDTDPSEYEDSAPAATSAPQAAAAPVSAPAVQAPAPAPVVVAPVAPAPQAAPAPAQTVSVSTPPKTTAQATNDMSDEDFLASLGV